MANRQQGKNSDAPGIPEADKKRIQKATNLLVAYINFMRWAGNFQRDEIARHPRHGAVVMLSPLQSGRFAFAVEGGRLLLGAQPFEMVWLAGMPFEMAYVSDRLYLSTTGAECMDVALPPLTVGFFIDQAAKREEMAGCTYVVPVPITVSEGIVTDVGRPIGVGISMKRGDVVTALNKAAIEQQNRRDLARLF